MDWLPTHDETLRYLLALLLLRSRASRSPNCPRHAVVRSLVLFVWPHHQIEAASSNVIAVLHLSFELRCSALHQPSEQQETRREMHLLLNRVLFGMSICVSRRQRSEHLLSLRSSAIFERTTTLVRPCPLQMFVCGSSARIWKLHLQLF